MKYCERNFEKDISIKLERFKNKEINFDDCLVTFLFSQMRNILERDAKLSEYKYIDLYSNWILHPKIDRNWMGKQVGENLIQILKSNKLSAQEKTKEINKTIGQWSLEDDIKKFSTHYKIDNPLLTEEYWKLAYSTILRLLVWKPIDLSDHSNAKVRAGEIDSITYDSYPILWLSSYPGKPTFLNIAFLRVGDQFHPELINEHESNGIIVFEAGLFHDAK